jgi:hypothetical protein
MRFQYSMAADKSPMGNALQLQLFPAIGVAAAGPAATMIGWLRRF